MIFAFGFLILSETIKKLADLFSKFPTVGQRTANRFVFHLLRLPKEKIDELAKAIQELKNNVGLCKFCFNPHESSGNLCSVCQNTSRNNKMLCIVEKEIDLISVENTKKYNGLYFILGGNIMSLKKNGSLRTDELKERLKNPNGFGLNGVNFAEIIIATNPTPEGRATSALVEKSLKELPQFSNFKITHLATGLPVGGELEYADEETLERAFEGRK